MKGTGVSAQFYSDILHKCLDSRLIVTTLADRDAIPGGYRYKGMVVFVSDLNKHYEFKISGAETTTAYADNNNWYEVEHHKHKDLNSLEQIGVDTNGNPTWGGRAWPSTSTSGGTVTGGDMYKSVYDSDNDGVIDLSRTCQFLDYGRLQNVPASFDANPHNHVITDVTGLQLALNDKANLIHNHDSYYAPVSHTHYISNVSELQNELDLKASVSHNHDMNYALLNHSHGASSLTGVVKTINGTAPDAAGNYNIAVSGTADWNTLLNKPSAFPPTVHTHDYAATIHTHDSLYAALVHAHSISDVTGLQTALDSKSDTTHTHDLSGFTGLVKSVNDQLPDANGNVVIATDVGSVDWSTITNRPTEFNPTAHSHAIADVTGLQTALDTKAESAHNHDALYSAIVHTHDIAEITNSIKTVNGQLPGLDGDVTVSAVSDWSAITNKPSAFTPTAHTHIVSEVTGAVASVNGITPDPVTGNVVIAVEAGSVAWGSITGTLTDQADLVTALGTKSDISHNHDSVYAAIEHTHNETELTGVVKTINGEAPDANGNYEIIAGSTGASLYRYEIIDAGGLAKSYVLATGLGVTLVLASNRATLVAPAGVQVVSASLHVPGSYVTATAFDIDYTQINVGTTWLDMVAPQFTVYSDVSGNRAFKSSITAHLNNGPAVLTLTNMTASISFWVNLTF